MKTISHQLREAVDNKVVLYPGMIVDVKTKSGSLVTKGYITLVDPEVGFVTVANLNNGSDFRVDVDPDEYEILIKNPENDENNKEVTTLYAKNSMPGIYAYSKTYMWK